MPGSARRARLAEKARLVGPTMVRGPKPKFSELRVVPVTRILFVSLTILASPAPPPPAQTFRLMVRITQHHRDGFPVALLLDPIDIDPRLDEPCRKPDFMLAIFLGTTLAPGFHPAKATPSRSSSSPCLKRPICGDRESVRCSETVSDARIETMSNST